MEDLRAKQKTLNDHLNDLDVQLIIAEAKHLDTKTIQEESMATMITLTDCTNQLTELMRQDFDARECMTCVFA